MKNVCIKILFTIVLTTIVFSLTNYCYADVIGFEIPSLEESFGYVNPNGHRIQAELDTYEPYWNIATLIRNLLIMFVIIVAIIFIFRKILKTKDSPIKKKIHIIISVILVIGYIALCGIMIDKANKANGPSYYGIIYNYYVDRVNSYQKISLSNIINILDNIKDTVGSSINHFNNYIYINVKIKINTSDYNYSDTCSPDEALQTIIDKIRLNLDSSNKYYLKFFANTKTRFVESIIVSDERIMQ
jgi:hypothetical protein